MRDRSDLREQSLETGAAEDRAPVASAAPVPRHGHLRPEAIPDLQRTVGNQAVTRLLGAGTSAPARGRLSRKHKEFPVAGVGSPGSTLFDWEGSHDDTSVWFDWSASWVDADRTGSLDLGRYGKTPGFADRRVSNDEGADRQELYVQAGHSGRLTIEVVAHFFVDMPGGSNQVYTQTATSTCSVTVGKDGKLHFGLTPPPNIAAATTKGARLVLLPGSASADDESGEVVVTTPYAGSQSSASEGTSNDIGIDVDVDIWGVKPSVGGSHGTSSETGRADPAPSGQQSFIANLKVIKPPPPDPTGTVEIGNIRAFVNRTHDVDFKRRDNAVLPPAERDRLLDWYFGLSRLTRKRLKLGEQPLQLDAFASQTQPAAKNQKLAERRQAAVIDVLGRFVAPENWPKHATAYGEDLLREDRRSKEEEDPSMWSVRLKVVDEVTPDEHELDDPEGFADLMPQ